MPESIFSFSLLGVTIDEIIAGITVKVKDEATGEFVASTDPQNEQLLVHDNNDGNFYVEGLPTGLYSVYAGSNTVAQAGLRNQPHIGVDVFEHLTAEAPHSGHATVQALDAHKNASVGVHGAFGKILGQGNVDGASLEVVNDILRLKDLGVGGGKLANGAVSSGKLADGAVITEKMADGAVTGEKIGQGEITSDKFDKLTDLPMTKVTAEPEATAANCWKVYWLKAPTYIALKAIIPATATEDAFSRVEILKVDLGTWGATTGTLEGNPTA